MSTLLISENFPPRTGGSSRWFWEIYRRLPREDYIIAAGEDQGQEEVDGSHDLRLVRVPLTMPEWGIRSLTGLRSYWQALIAVRKIVKIFGVKSIHCGRSLPEGWLAWMLKQRYGIPYACYVHGEEMNTASSSREFSWMTDRVFQSADFVIANSRNTAGIIVDQWNLPRDRIRLLNPGVDVNYFLPARPNAIVRAALNWGDRPVILTVGRLQKRKGHDQLIRALNRIVNFFPNVLYAIVGDGEERPFLENLVQQEGFAEHVQFLGEVDDQDLVNCYQQCDLFVLPNRQVDGDFEGFGMVLVEAQACGKPVVAGASGGTAETMRIPETGRCISCDSHEDLARVIIELLKDHKLRIAMGVKARQWVVERFDWDSLARQAEQIFNRESAGQGVQTYLESVQP